MIGPISIITVILLRLMSEKFLKKFCDMPFVIKILILIVMLIPSIVADIIAILLIIFLFIVLSATDIMKEVDSFPTLISWGMIKRILYNNTCELSGTDKQGTMQPGMIQPGMVRPVMQPSMVQPGM